MTPSAVVRDVATFGQVFTPSAVVAAMLALRQNRGRVLEPSCGDGAFLRHLPDAVALELDARHAPPGARVGDFFALDPRETFDTIIGNPPYVRFQDIMPKTRALLDMKHFDRRTNLYLFFIEKAVRHLRPGGELIFITPRDFLKATAAVHLNRRLAAQGSITHAIDLGDTRIFADALPNCLIWRYVLGERGRRMQWAEVSSGAGWETRLAAPAWQSRNFLETGGHLQFVRGDYPLRLGDLAQPKVGAVSGADEIFRHDGPGAREFVCSETATTGRTRRMLWPGPTPAPQLQPFKARLLARRICSFTEANWWHWGRAHAQSDAPRVYVNHKTRRPAPFFIHPCRDYEGSVLAIFPLDQKVPVAELAAALNAVDWADLGYVCDGRFQFTQRSLVEAPLPADFARFLPERTVLANRQLDLV